MILLPHIVLWLTAAYYFFQNIYGTSFSLTSITVLAALLLVYGVAAIFLHLLPTFQKSALSLRLRVMQGGEKILKYSLRGILLQIPFYLIVHFTDWPMLPPHIGNVRIVVILIDLFVCVLHFYLFILNGCIRILCTCKSLGSVRRLITIAALWIPVVNLFSLHYLRQKAREEYDVWLCRFETGKERDGSMLCATRYPILLLHGIGFRDMKYFNYWGRIPKELTKNGAVVYYGHQQAFGTIEDNARIIREKIWEVLKENHCDKVNIIAHSKGGLDARYLISSLHMEAQVASLTTMSTPHRGSELMNVLNLLPDGIYRFIAAMFDKSFHKFGDETPDCYHSSKQLSPSFCQEFNDKYKNAPGVYYQSYTSVLKHALGDSLLSLPNLLMFFAGAPKNDGLVSVESAKWGTFKKVFQSTGRRGISHGDMIDLKREDYKGFDVIEAYIEIVAELKKSGY